MDKLTALNFLPQEQLVLAYSHEKMEVNRYRCLALRFLSIDPPVNRLMSAIGIECVHRLEWLKEVATRMDLSACVAEPSYPGASPLFNINKQHFFVVDELMGTQLLEQAEKAAKETFMFFSWLLETNATPELDRPFLGFVNQKTNEFHVLQECRQNWTAGMSIAF
ncbi:MULTISPECIES: hypothetical protein [unclassified Halomonas]|uniref:hypothetical protein n=1 Tax=unclassified Halomonas TaxID=2609666 RepID=UPI0006D96016|nr:MULTISPECIES: hypothetical protein [unclassified Halomonas]KPQ27419.1 MAG: hypothetical protein HLUCCO06_13480 [Halomonas sp. HL-93]SBR49860.1 hypothetical protein GA0071314_2399 [Halomonas sp. HL-93]SNY96569.1 hypothetical protein SAMN04488142_1110 [Halomonas sp. hl-4]